MYKKLLFIISAIFLFIAMAENTFADVSALLEQAVAYAEDDDHKQAETIYKTIIQDYPGTDYALEAQIRLILLYIFWDKPAMADVSSQAVLAEFSQGKSTPEAVVLVADMYFRLGRHQDALELFQYCLDRWPDGEQAIWSQLGLCISNIALGNDSEAQAAINGLLTAYSEHERLIEAVVDISDTYRASLRYGEALKYYQYAVDHWPNDAEEAIWSQLGVAISNIALGNDAEAQAAVDKLITDFSEHKQIPAAIIEISDTYFDFDKYDEAGELYQYVLETWSGGKYAILAQRGVGMFNAALGNDADANAVIEILLANFGEHPDLPTAVLQIAEPYYKKGLQEEVEDPNSQAREYLQKALSIYERVTNEVPGFVATADTCLWTGNCYHRLGEYQKAIVCYQEMVDEYPGYHMGWYALFMIVKDYERLNESGILTDSEAEVETKAVYERLLAEYPACKVAKIAQRWLSNHISK
ncbi:MAG: tetratricopeptide repeat protein [Planctomycetota bacterium]|jgi:tetratricopeptide (TPR) repeat protein